jgi:hypothetical protein
MNNLNDRLTVESKVLKDEERPRNIVICKVCLEVLESVGRHDFVQCDCSNKTYVDGGTAYQRIGAVDLGLVEVLRSPDRDPKVEARDLDRVQSCLDSRKGYL